MNEWHIVGSSLKVESYFDAACFAHPDATTFACNSAIKLFTARRPDYFIAVDENAGIMLHRLICDAIEQGTQFVSYAKSLLVKNIKREISCPGFEVDTPMPTVLLDIDASKVHTEYQPGRIVFAQYSGLAAMQYAIQQGAERVIITGCDGYPGDRPLEDFPVVTFDGHGGDSWGKRQTDTVIQPFMQSMVDACPDIEFVQYGEPLYDVEGANYTIKQAVQV